MGNQPFCCGAEDVANLHRGQGKFLPTLLSPVKMNQLGVHFSDTELRVSDSGATSFMNNDRVRLSCRPVSSLSCLNSTNLGKKMHEESLTNLSNADVQSLKMMRLGNSNISLYENTQMIKSEAPSYEMS